MLSNSAAPQLRFSSDMKDDRNIDKLSMPKSRLDAMAKAVPTDVVKAIVGDHYKRATP
jgi:hypothetical protein